MIMTDTTTDRALAAANAREAARALDGAGEGE
jgi:hypothetical protein